MRDWYSTEWERDPKGSFIADLALGGGVWDTSIVCSPCDLHWSPGWTLAKHGWPSAGYSVWPDPEEYHRLQSWRAKLPAHLQ